MKGGRGEVEGDKGKEGIYIRSQVSVEFYTLALVLCVPYMYSPRESKILDM